MRPLQAIIAATVVVITSFSIVMFVVGSTKTYLESNEPIVMEKHRG